MSPVETENNPSLVFHPTRRSLVAATLAVAATYAYFLIFAQFGFLRALTAALGEGHDLVRPVLAVMGAAGIGGSVLVARRSRRSDGIQGMAMGFLLAGAAAGLSMVARTPVPFFCAAALTGLGTGMLTVGLAARLVRETGERRLGLCLGAGTGLAYATCSWPPIFLAEAKTQASAGLLALALGWFALRNFKQGGTEPTAPGADYQPRGMAAWTLILLALVGFDSAAFYLIQHTPDLQAAWAGSPQLAVNAAVHLVAGLGVGLALDRGWLGAATLAATGMLAAGATLLFARSSTAGAALYAAGVSVYSAVLVFYPARAGRPALAALVYAVAGWTGSALGIGLAEQCGRLAGWVPVAVLSAVAGLLALRGKSAPWKI
ncbi:MAG TPA: hypothetical protein VHN79_02700 [Lacunisphaera sp.]|nr:hypothetical protein [Lacunisphaera sp.]